MANHSDTLDALPIYDDDWQDEPPHGVLAQEEFRALRRTPGSSRAYNRGSSATYQRSRPGSPGPSSNQTKKLVNRPKQHLARRMRYQAPSPSFARNPYGHSYPPLLPLLPFVQQPPLAYYPPRRRRGEQAPQYDPPPTRQLSVFAYFGLPSSLVVVVALICFTVVAVLTMLRPITQGLGNAVNAFSRINPAGVIGAIVNPITSIPVTHMYCNTIGVGCGPDRHAAFKTEKFGSLQRPPSTELISTGTDVFDCFNDLRITRQQENAISYLTTLSRKVMQSEHVLEAQEEFRDNLAKLAETKKEVLYNANNARVTGSHGLKKIIDEVHPFRGRSPNSALANICSNLSPARKDLNSTASSILSSAQAIKEVEELTKLVGQQAHKEISRLHDIQNKEESGLGYLAYGWTEPSWKFFQPGWVGRKEQRREAALFLKEVIQAIDQGETTLTRSAINIEDFYHQIERACSLQNPSEGLGIDAHPEQLVSWVEGLEAGLDEVKRKEEAERQAILAGATTPSLSPAKLGEAGTEERKRD